MGNGDCVLYPPLLRLLQMWSAHDIPLVTCDHFPGAQSELLDKRGISVSCQAHTVHICACVALCSVMGWCVWKWFTQVGRGVWQGETSMRWIRTACHPRQLWSAAAQSPRTSLTATARQTAAHGPKLWRCAATADRSCEVYQI